jgi:hypothetical protein
LPQQAQALQARRKTSGLGSWGANKAHTLIHATIAAVQ